jgi:predicted patatin/cPLA2 family phospholipase
MPYLCRKVQLDGQEYLDGGVSSRLGLEFLEEHPEYDRVVVVLTRRLQYRKKAPSKLIRNLAHRLYSEYPQLLEVLLQEDVLYARDRETLARLQDEGRILVIQPQTELDIGRLERDKDKLKLGYETGQRDGERYLRQVQEWFQDSNSDQSASEIS